MGSRHRDTCPCPDRGGRTEGITRRRTTEQQIAAAETKLARLKAKARAAAPRRKITTDAAVISDAMTDPAKARTIADPFITAFKDHFGHTPSQMHLGRR